MKKPYLILVIVTIFGISTYAQTKKPTIEWVEIPSGTFIMGSDTSEVGRSNNETQHQVTLSAFKMSKYEITFEQYDLFCDATGREKPSDEGFGRGELPVINVSWDDATAFAAWMGCRLPTEAEWEYACRAGASTMFYTGNELKADQANFSFSCLEAIDQFGNANKLLPVGSFAPNKFGLFDMHGNAMEWCSDWFDYYSTSAQTNPKGPSSGFGHIVRSGGWSSCDVECRSAAREHHPEISGVGIRLVKDN